MGQAEFNSQLGETLENMSNLIAEQQKKIEAMQNAITTIGNGLTDTMETVQHHDEGINMIMQRMLELGLAK